VGDVAGIVLSAVQALEQRTAALQAQAAQGERQSVLIAEEVAKVYPELVTRNAQGQVETIRYQELTPMLLNEVQHQQQALSIQQRQLSAQAQELAELQAQHTRVQAALEQQQAQNARLQATVTQQHERDAALTARLERLEAAAARAGALANR